MNATVFHFITGNFLKGLCLDLRRLTEVGMLVGSDASRDRSVYSLHSLLDDIRAHRQEYTRRRRFLACRLEYHVDAIKRRRDQYFLEKFPSGVGVMAMPAELSDAPSEITHKEWDKLSRCPPDRRGPEDLVAADHFDRLEADIAAIRSAVKNVVNKSLAHAATPQSRQVVEGEKQSVTRSELLDLVVKAGCIVNSLSAILCGAVHPFLAEAEFHKWEYWGRGWEASSEELEAAWRKWQSRVDRIEPVYPE